jgi:8-oxo-dGTP pyrophosphatase MutT (NUDIX family)
VSDPTEVWDGPIVDQPAPRQTVATTPLVDGYVWSVRRDVVDFDGNEVERDVLVHPGAVAIIALDDTDRVLLVRQYRHPVGMWLLEPPAGLLDVHGEQPWVTAQRELAEEAGYKATNWTVLVDLLNSPGGSSEAIRVFLARDLTPLAGGRLHTSEAEEAHLPQVWVSIDEVVASVLSGELASPSLVAGVLAAHAYRQRGWAGLRPVDAPWPTRDHLVGTGRVHNQGPNQ